MAETLEVGAFHEKWGDILELLGSGAFFPIHAGSTERGTPGETLAALVENKVPMVTPRLGAPIEPLFPFRACTEERLR